MIKRNDGISKDDICQNQFTAYVVLAVKRKRQSYIKKKQREHEKETRTKKEAEQSEFRTAGYDMWSRMEPQNEKLMAAMQQLSLKERFVVTEYALKGKVRPLFGGHAGCGLILGSLLSANGRKYLYKKVPAGKTPRPIQRNAIYYRHRLQK